MFRPLLLVALMVGLVSWASPGLALCELECKPQNALEAKQASLSTYDHFTESEAESQNSDPEPDQEIAPAEASLPPEVQDSQTLKHQDKSLAEEESPPTALTCLGKALIGNKYKQEDRLFAAVKVALDELKRIQVSKEYTKQLLEGCGLGELANQLLVHQLGQSELFEILSTKVLGFEFKF